MKTHGIAIEKKRVKKVQTLVTVNDSLKNYFIKNKKLCFNYELS